MSNSEGGKAARVESLWRYPVKSMQGAPHEELSLDAGGVAGDRAFGVLDVNTGTILSAKREGRLLEASASTATGDLVVTLPDGEELRRGVALDEGLSLWLGRPVRVVLAATFGAGTYAMPEDFERDDSNLVQWEGPVGSFVDESPLHLLTTGDLTQLSLERPDLHWDVRRFRPNVVIATALTSPELMAPGRHVQLGDLDVAVLKGCSRCVMTTRVQPNALPRQLDILRHVARAHGGDVGVRAIATGSGTLRVGDLVTSGA